MNSMNNNILSKEDEVTQTTGKKWLEYNEWKALKKFYDNNKYLPMKINDMIIEIGEINTEEFKDVELAEFINALRDIGKYDAAGELEAEVLNRKYRNEAY